MSNGHRPPVASAAVVTRLRDSPPTARPARFLRNPEAETPWRK